MHVGESVCLLRGGEEGSLRSIDILWDFSGACNNMAGLVCPWHLQKRWWVSFDVWDIILEPTSLSSHLPLVSKSLSSHSSLFWPQMVHSSSQHLHITLQRIQGDLWTNTAGNSSHVSPSLFLYQTETELLKARGVKILTLHCRKSGACPTTLWKAPRIIFLFLPPPSMYPSWRGHWRHAQVLLLPTSSTPPLGQDGLPPAPPPCGTHALS